MQCGRTWKLNGRVNGSNVYNVDNQGYIVHNEENSSTPEQWGRWETEGGSALSTDLLDNGPGYGADALVDVPSCD